MINLEKGESAGNVLLYRIDEQYLSPIKENFLHSSIQVFTANDLDEALKIFGRVDIDIVLADYDPETEKSVKFLAIVKKQFPSIYRIMMCNASEQKKAIFVVFKGIANNTFEKPHGIVSLMSSISHILDIRRTLKENKLLKLLCTIENLIAIPSTYFEFTKARENNKPVEEIVNILERDISISTKILQIANSAFFRTDKIASIEHAYNYLGEHNIKNIVTIFCYHSKETLNKVQNDNFDALIKHSLRVNKEFHSSYQLRTSETLPDSFASIGITHDIGKIIMLKYLPDRFNSVAEFMEDNAKEDFHSSEIKLGYEESTHAEIGAYFLDLWNLPGENVHVALYHHDQENAMESYKKILEIFEDVNYHMEFCKYTKTFD